MPDETIKGRRRAKWCAVGVAILMVMSIWGWRSMRLDSSIESLLPEGSEARQAVAFIRESNFADKAVLRFRLRGEGTLDQLIAAADELAVRVDPNLIKRVIRLPKEADALDQIFAFLDRSGELLDERDLAELNTALTPDALRKRMRECYVQLTKFEGSFMQQIIRRDPVGVNTRILARLYTLKNAIGYQAEPRQGHLVHPNGRELILVMETVSPVTSVTGSRALVKHLNELCASVPAGIQVTPICGHLHTAQNDQTIHRDMNIATLITGVGFALVFLGAYRDWRSGVVFLLPVLSVGIAIGLCGLLTSSISMLVLGLASAIVGDAVIYSIHVYGAARQEANPYTAAGRITKPLLVGMLTTLAVFGAFLFSRIPAYRQLGLMACISLLLSFLMAIYLLPALIRPGVRKLVAKDVPLHQWGRKMAVVSLITWGLLAVACFLATRTTFDSDIARLDGVSAAVAAAEADFQRTWGRGDGELAIVVASGKTREAAERLNDSLCAILTQRLPADQFVSLSHFWPSLSARQENLARWNDFWNPQRVSSLKTELAQATDKYGFALNAFHPCLQALAHPTDPNQAPGELFASIEQQFVLHGNGDWKLLSFFPDTAENVTLVRDLLRDQPGAAVVSKRALGQSLADAAASECRLIAWYSAGLIAVCMLILVRKPKDIVLSLLPPAAALIGLLALLSLTSLPLNLVSIIAASAVIGLCVNYGTLMVDAWKQPDSQLIGSLMSVHLAAIMTLISTAALLFAHHPAVFLAGSSLSAGVLAGYGAALLTVPGTCYLLGRRGNRSKS